MALLLGVADIDDGVDVRRRKRWRRSPIKCHVVEGALGNTLEDFPCVVWNGVSMRCVECRV